ncbi:MAG: T9SS type A sorting domain-containing protein, partial [Bacteroidales bacterium]|nr:T9SS type A sorting domain-containing protein [Bacteroidales bacterium]
YIDDIEIYGDPVIISDENRCNKEISIYPNPTNGIMNISGIKSNSNTYLKVADIYGRIILKEAISSDNNKLDLSCLPRGLYIIELFGVGTYYVEKVILK